MANRLTEQESETRKALVQRYNKTNSMKAYNALMDFEARMLKEDKNGG